MSFSIQAAGLVPDAIAQVKAVELVGENEQFEATRDYILSRLAAWPSEGSSPKGVFVEASGHQDQFTQNVTLTIRPMWLRVPKEDA